MDAYHDACGAEGLQRCCAEVLCSHSVGAVLLGCGIPHYRM
jgi:hypothetical protein